VLAATGFNAPKRWVVNLTWLRPFSPRTIAASIRLRVVAQVYDGEFQVRRVEGEIASIRKLDVALAPEGSAQPATALSADSKKMGLTGPL
jgi:hypothetical protein